MLENIKRGLKFSKYVGLKQFRKAASNGEAMEMERILSAVL